MVKKTLLFNKLKRFKKGSATKAQFFSDQNLLKNQLSIDDIETKEKQQQEIQEKLGEVNQEVASQNSKKKKISNVIMFALNIVIVAVILIYQLSTSEVVSFAEILNSGFFRGEYLILIALCFVVSSLLDMLRTSMLLQQSTKKRHFSLSYKMNALGRYWDSITPLSSGGEPYQIYYLNKYGIPTGTAISVPLARYVIFQLGWLIVSIGATIYCSQVYAETNLVSVASFIGFGLNAIMLIGTWVLSVSKKLGKILVAKSLKLLQKMKIVKNYEKQYDKVMNTVGGFQSTMTLYTKNLKSFIFMVFTQILQSIVQFSMPYFIYLLLGGEPGIAIWVNITMLSILIDLASSFIPLPGGTGMNEISFTIVFADIFRNGTVFWGMLISRFMNYYIFIIQGLIITIYDYVIGNKKLEWQKKKWELEQESTKFKENQVKKYKKRSKGKIKI